MASQIYRHLCILAVAFGCSQYAADASAQRSADGIIERMDRNNDGKISADEFRARRKPFSFFDQDNDGFVTRSEIEAALDRRPRVRAGADRSGNADGRLDGRVSLSRVDAETRCAIARGRRCDIDLAINRGLFETGLRPRFPEGPDCRDIDEHWAISYGHKRDRESYHGGIDMPAPFGTPIVAVAAGTVIAKFDGERSYRGIEIVLRHSPEDTGIPLWIYTQYAHFDEMPKVRVGQRVRVGEVLGPTGNSGKTPSNRAFGKERRPAVHFAVWYSTNPQFFVGRRKVIPIDGYWMDPNALYRMRPPFDSKSMKSLPKTDKHVSIPVIFEDGTTIPAESKLIWPYRCARD